jgi:hypothetical protein
MILHIRLNQLISLFFIFNFFTISLISLIYSENFLTYLGFENFFLIFLISIMFVFFLQTKLKSNIIFIFLSLIILFYYLQRFNSILINPELKYLNYRFYAIEYSRLLSITLFYSICAIFPLLFSKNKEIEFNKYSINLNHNLSIIFIFLTIIILVINIFFGKYFFGVEITLIQTSFFMKLIKIMFNANVFYVLSLLLIFHKIKFNDKRFYKYIYIIVFLYTTSLLINGSRGSLYDALLPLLIIWLIYNQSQPHIPISLKNIFYILFVIISIPTFFQLGDNFRLINWRNYDFSVFKDFFDFGLYLNVSQRLSLLDPSILIYNIEPDIIIENYINLKNILLLSLDRILPSSFVKFDTTNLILSESVFQLAYTKKDISFLTKTFHADMYGSFSYSYILFGLIGGGIFITLTTLFFNFIYNKSKNILPSVIIILIYKMWLVTFGIDNLIARFFYFISMIYIYYLILSIGNKFYQNK